MTTPRKIVWIDDNPSRESTAADLGARFLNVKGEDLGPLLKELLDGAPPRLVIIDHVLDKAADTHPLFSRGSTVAEAIKEKWPSCPVIGVTNARKLKAIDRRTKGAAYDDLVQFENFSEYFDRIKGIASGFALVAGAPPDAGRLIRFLRPPRAEKGRLLEALGDDLKSPRQDPSVASRMFRWVEHLMERPGFLLDELWSATLLGLNESGFRKVSRRFDGARYHGIFVRPRDQRWWTAELSAELYRRCEPRPGELSWQAGRRLRGVAEGDFSRCHKCGEGFPETVACLDEASEARRAMHLKCTELDPRFRRELYFEDMRVMRGD